MVGLYITACASGAPTRGGKEDSVSTIERRLSAIGWNYTQRGEKLDRKDRAIATVLAGIRKKHAAPPRQKEVILPEDLIAMLETLERGTLRGMRDRAMLLVGFSGGLRRSEITGLDLGRDQTEDSSGWIEIFDKGALLTLRGKTGWRPVYATTSPRPSAARCLPGTRCVPASPPRPKSTNAMCKSSSAMPPPK
ncbi:protein of unknown function (plasmid) [Shinella sp. WSC3-e]|nr:hypothetical protein SHINE37_100153 [Rhizobiaceae bacterium]CAK7261699.1 protein of unknown function [Shinella sp. WSC3-e]